MSETIISKRCSKCKEIKPLSEFHNNRTRRDGHNAECKLCCNKYGKKYRQTEKSQIYQKNYQKHYQKEYSKTTKGKIAHRKAQKQYDIRHPEREEARHAVEYAIKIGQLPPVDSLKCSCGNPAKHYHHHKGYAPELWLDVIPVCRKCHILKSRKAS